MWSVWAGVRRAIGEILLRTRYFDMFLQHVGRWEIALGVIGCSGWQVTGRHDCVQVLGICRRSI